MNVQSLRQQNAVHAGTGGVSRKNRSLGFRPAFLDFDTQTIYLSRFADGRPAPFHLLDGLPNEIVVDRTLCGRVAAVKASVIAGFVRDGFFFTREQAARAARQWGIA
jgi:hypothetical protein